MTTGLRLLLSAVFALFAGVVTLFALPWVLPGVGANLPTALVWVFCGAYSGFLLFRRLPRPQC
jgi:hypothetical protein